MKHIFQPQQYETRNQILKEKWEKRLKNMLLKKQMSQWWNQTGTQKIPWEKLKENTTV